MKPISYLCVAETLAQLAANASSSEEERAASSRASISRAYYSVFHVAVSILEDIVGQKTAKIDSAHEHIFRIMNNCDDAELKAIASVFSTLRKLRVASVQRRGSTSRREPGAPWISSLQGWC